MLLTQAERDELANDIEREWHLHLTPCVSPRIRARRRPIPTTIPTHIVEPNPWI